MPTKTPAKRAPRSRGKGPDQVECRYLTVPQAAKYLSLTRQGVYLLVQTNRIPYTRLGPPPLPGEKDTRRLRFDIVELDQFMAASAVPAVAS